MSENGDDPSKPRQKSKPRPLPFTVEPPRLSGQGRTNFNGKKVKYPGVRSGKRPSPPDDPSKIPGEDLPITPSERARLVPMNHPPKLPESIAHQAPNPPPGYRYTMTGKLVPLVETRLPMTDPKAQDIFLEIIEITGSMRAGLDAVGQVTADAVVRQCDKDPGFNDRLLAAMDRHREKLYAAAVQRAVHGYDVPIVGGQFKDEIVAYERRYSDNLLALLLKRHYQEFRDAASVAGSKVTINNNQQTNTVKVDVDMTKLTRGQREHLRGFLKDMPIAKSNLELDEQMAIETTSTEEK